MWRGEDNTDQILREAIEALTSAAESRELNGAGHGEMVARYSELMARALGLSPEDIDDLVYAARVHDVGKIFVPERILNKSGPLTEEEFYLVKMHAEWEQKSWPLCRGQEIAGGGRASPRGLRRRRLSGRACGEEIPLWARIMAIADAYVNMTTERSFAAPRPANRLWPNWND